MKLLTLPAMAAILFVFTLTSGITNGSGAPYGKTGSPGDGNTNCTKCHTGALTVDNTFLNSDIPVSGYQPGQTYTISLTASKTGINKFGFELTAEDSTHAKAGAFIITNSTETKKVMDEVTHTGNGTTASNGQKSWSVQWTAPAAGSGDIIFFSAVNAANGDGGTGGDAIILSSYLVSEDLSSGLNRSTKNNEIKLFPSITDKHIVLQSSISIHSVEIYDLKGNQLINNKFSINTKQAFMEVSPLSSGIYIATVQLSDGSTQSLRFIKK